MSGITILRFSLQNENIKVGHKTILPEEETLHLQPFEAPLDGSKSFEAGRLV
jgi:hypothetical protein